MCMNPEFLTEIAGTWTEAKDFNRDFFTEDRIVINEEMKKKMRMLQLALRRLKMLQGTG